MHVPCCAYTRYKTPYSCSKLRICVVGTSSARNNIPTRQNPAARRRKTYAGRTGCALQADSSVHYPETYQHTKKTPTNICPTPRAGSEHHPNVASLPINEYRWGIGGGVFHNTSLAPYTTVSKVFTTPLIPAATHFLRNCRSVHLPHS